MSAEPFHILLLAGGSRLRGDKRIRDECDDGDHSDYLLRRNEFRKKTQARLRGEISGESLKDKNPSIKSLASQLEIAMSACCERVPFTADSSGQKSEQEAILPRRPCREASILRSGKEGQFLKLLLMYCPKHALGHRALAVAVLQQTVDWETSDANRSKLTASASEASDQTPCDILVDEERFLMKRTTSFLKGGGMKLLTRWFIDSITVMSVPSSNTKIKDLSTQRVASPTGCLLLPLLHLLHCIPFYRDIVVDSQIHKSIKRLKKALDRLVQGLNPNTLEKEVHPIAGGLSVGKVMNAVEKLMSSWAEAAAAEATSNGDVLVKLDPFQNLKTKINLRFEELSKFQNEDGDPPLWLPKSVVGMWRAAPASRVGSAEHTSNALRPSPLPSPVLTKCAKDAEGISGKNAKIKEDQRKNTLELFSRKRKMAEILETRKAAKVQLIKPPTSKKVSWADRPMKGTITSRPLKEEFFFRSDEQIAHEPESITFQGVKEEEPITPQGVKEEDSDMEDLF